MEFITNSEGLSLGNQVDGLPGALHDRLQALRLPQIAIDGLLSDLAHTVAPTHLYERNSKRTNRR